MTQSQDHNFYLLHIKANRVQLLTYSFIDNRHIPIWFSSLNVFIYLFYIQAEFSLPPLLQLPLTLFFSSSPLIFLFRCLVDFQFYVWLSSVLLVSICFQVACPFLSFILLLWLIFICVSIIFWFWIFIQLKISEFN